MDLWLPPKPAIILPSRDIVKPVSFKPAWLPGICMPFAPSTAAPPPPPSSEFRTSVVDATDQTTYTFNNVDIGVAHSTRRVVVAVASVSTISSATIGGVSATIHIQVGSGDQAGLISAVVPTGTTATISITFTAAGLMCGIGVYRLINETSGSPHATASDTTVATGVLSTTINVPTNGSLFAVAKAFQKAGPLTFTWSGATERYDQAVESLDTHSGASETGLASQTGRTVSVTLSASTNVSGMLAVMTWG